jgi:monoamine oxidase
MGLPGNMQGPAFQVYDASTKDGSVNALTFFALVPPGSPAKDHDKALVDQVTTQISTVWKSYRGIDLSEQVKKYADVHVQHWPMEKYISEDAAPKQIHPHPYPVRALSTNEWDGRLLFAGSETDQKSPGVMEGAVGAALRVANDIRGGK